ncbi:MAG: nucleotidyltransferase domain-containing protein [Planctomycetaceae bacterium]
MIEENAEDDLSCIDPGRNFVNDRLLETETFGPWPNIERGVRFAKDLRTQLCSTLSEQMSEDYDVVVFGSLARGEWTSGSDVDWTLLLDGQASTDHRLVHHKIRDLLEDVEFKGKKLVDPGGEGVFGKMAFSHDIIHHIGGQSDTNKNTTQRILLLLEAASISETCGSEFGPFDRVVREILVRYLKDDTICLRPPRDESRIPRFLLNDIVRFWRTMCVDFAYKEWEQAGQKWAIRNLKLRVSRKLLFVSGLLTVFSCYHNHNLIELGNSDEIVAGMQQHLLQFVRSSPINIVIWTLDRLDMMAGEGRELLNCYDAFLEKLNDPTIRERLANLDSRQVYQDEVYQECHEISDEFQRILNRVFFEVDSELREFITEYGVF